MLRDVLGHTLLAMIHRATALSMKRLHVYWVKLDALVAWSLAASRTASRVRGTISTCASPQRVNAFLT